MASTSQPAAPASNFPAIAFMITAGVVNMCMLTMIKYLSDPQAEDPLHPLQIGFFRCAVGFLVLVPVIWRAGGPSVMKTDRIGAHLLRGVLNAVGMLLFFWSLSLTSLDLVSAISFSAPLFAALLAIFILGEKVGVRRWAGLIIGFLGTLIIIRPGAGAIDTGAIMALSSSLAWASAIIVIKQLTKTETPLAITAWAALFVGLIALFPALFVWKWPEAWQWGIILLIGALGSIVQLCFAKAFSLADTTVVMPFDFLKLVWAAVIGYIVFQDVPLIWTWIGGSVIFASTVYVAYRERVKTGTRPPRPAGGGAIDIDRD